MAPRTVAQIALDIATSAWTGIVVDARRDEVVRLPASWPTGNAP
jgi:hypothetical protein